MCLIVVSGGLVTDAPLQDGTPWTLGGYIDELGGARRSKCEREKDIWPVCQGGEREVVEVDEEEEVEVDSEEDTVSIHNAIIVIINL